MNLYLFKWLTLGERPAMAHITCDIHFVNNLQTNFLIDMNIIKSEHINTDISLQKTIIRECKKMLIDLQIISRSNKQIQYTVQTI